MGRMAQTEAPLRAAPEASDTEWAQPTRAIADELRNNAAVRRDVPEIARIVSDGLAKLGALRRQMCTHLAADLRTELTLTGDDASIATQALQKLNITRTPEDTTTTMLTKCHGRVFGGRPSANANVNAMLVARVDDDEALGIILYTHDLNNTDHRKEGNLYFELNRSLREMASGENSTATDAWSGYMHVTLSGLRKLPDFEGVVYRGVPDIREVAERKYYIGRRIKWSGFSSSSTRLAASQAIGLAPANAVIFKINVTTGKVIKALSFFEEEGEVLLWPGQKFQVTRPAYVGEGGYTFVDMSENAVLDMLVF